MNKHNVNKQSWSYSRSLRLQGRCVGVKFWRNMTLQDQDWTF